MVARRVVGKPDCTPLASRDTTTELIRVLCYPRFALADDEREDLLADYLTYTETVVVSPVPIVPACRDRFDRAFLELTLAGRADALVTGDKDLLVLAGDFSCADRHPPFAAQVTERRRSASFKEGRAVLRGGSRYPATIVERSRWAENTSPSHSTRRSRVGRW